MATHKKVKPPQHNSNEKKSYINLTNLIAVIILCIIAVLTFYFTQIMPKEGNVKKLNNDAFDLMGNRKGSEHINVGVISNIKDSNRMELALRKIEEGLRILPDNCRGLELKAIYCAEIGGEINFNISVRLFERVIRLYPNYACAYNNMGNLFSIKGQFEYSIEYYKKSIKIYDELIQKSPLSIENNKYYNPHNGLGNSFFKIGKYSDAKKYFRKTTKLRPDFPPAWNNLGSTLFKLRKYKESIIYFKKAIKLNSKFSLAYVNLARAQIKIEDTQEAEKNLNIAITLGLDEENIKALKQAIHKKKFH